MNRPKILPAFTAEERDQVHKLLGAKVAYMMGRKMEEGDWASVYCTAKGIELKGWSNLRLDVVHGNFGIEHKALSYSTKKDISSACGTRLMHPSATRSLRLLPYPTPPNDAMADVLTQYGEYLTARRSFVAGQAPSGTTPDMRTGWLLYQTNLNQFLYFEEEMMVPDPNDYVAEWKPREASGARKGSNNLWIFEKETGAKKFSVTNEAGVKLQPYFDVPAITNPNIYMFTVIGEVLMPGFVRVWVTEATARELQKLVGSLETKELSRVIIEECTKIAADGTEIETELEGATAVVLTIEAYEALHSALPGVSDEHSFQLLAQHLRHD